MKQKVAIALFSFKYRLCSKRTLAPSWRKRGRGCVLKNYPYNLAFGICDSLFLQSVRRSQTIDNLPDVEAVIILERIVFFNGRIAEMRRIQVVKV